MELFREENNKIKLFKIFNYMWIPKVFEATVKSQEFAVSRNKYFTHLFIFLIILIIHIYIYIKSGNLKGKSPNYNFFNNLVVHT